MSMVWYFIVMIVLASVIVLSLFPLKITMRTYWNIGKNLGVVSFSIWGVNLYCVQIEITESAINIIRAKRKERQIQFEALTFGAIFIHHFVQAVFRYLKILEISIYTDMSKKNDAMATALINGAIVQLMYCVYAVLYGLKGNFTAYNSVGADFQENKCSLSNYTSVILVPIVLCICVVRALLRTKKGIEKYGKFARKERKSN